MPVRKVSNRGGNSIGCFPSIKLGRMVDYESLIERDYICLLEYDPDVTWYEEQPLTITYEWDDKELTYTPDFHVVKRGRHFLVECKPEAFVDSEENRRKFLVADSWCAENRYIFEVVTDEKLRHGYKLKNIGLLLQFARHRIDPVVRQRILAFLVAPSSPVTVADVMLNAVPDNPQSVMIPILNMVFRHELTIALDDAPITVASPIGLPKTMEVE